MQENPRRQFSLTRPLGCLGEPVPNHRDNRYQNARPGVFAASCLAPGVRPGIIKWDHRSRRFDAAINFWRSGQTNPYPARRTQVR